MHSHFLRPGRHELGQNFLTDPRAITQFVQLVAQTRGSILELGAGDGAITHRLVTLGRRVTAIDIDERRVKRLRRELPNAHVEHADALNVPLTDSTVVGNIPFGLTTPILRRLLSAGQWQHAVLLVQWEVARKRAGVGGKTMMTAQNDPWFEFRLAGRVPARSFSPRPSVDGGLLTVHRRHSPLVPVAMRRDYEVFIKRVFTGAGGTLQRVVQQATGAGRAAIGDVFARHHISERALPRDLSAQQWQQLWHLRRRQSADR